MHDAFAAYVSEWMGLDIDSVGMDRIHDVLHKECRRLNLTGQEYIDRLPHDRILQAQLYDAMVIPETWFMRGREALEWLCTFVKKEQLAERPDVPLRILSIPCSTGEEPYSILMMLEKNGVDLDNVEITAVDISNAALQKAGTGVYRSYSFRAIDPETRSRYFTKTEDGEQLDPRIGRRVEFLCANMAEKDFLSDKEAYHVIFCRNLLIYFTSTCRKTALENIRRLLTRDGVIFAGHSEAAYFAYKGFQAVEEPRVFAFRNEQPAIKKAAHGKTPDAKAPRKAIVREHKQPVRKKKSKRPLVTLSIPDAVAPVAPPAVSALDTIRLEADAGNHSTALLQCEKYLEHHPVDVDALCLAAVLHETGGNHQKAEEYFRKTLYLEPRHEEGLAHYILLLQSSGRTEQADILMRRQQRDV